MRVNLWLPLSTLALLPSLHWWACGPRRSLYNPFDPRVGLAQGAAGSWFCYAWDLHFVAPTPQPRCGLQLPLCFQGSTF